MVMNNCFMSDFWQRRASVFNWDLRNCIKEMIYKTMADPGKAHKQNGGTQRLTPLRRYEPLKV